MAFSKVAPEVPGPIATKAKREQFYNRLRDELGGLSVSLDGARADAKSLSESLGAIEGFVGARTVRDLRGVPSVGEFLRRSKGRQLSVPLQSKPEIRWLLRPRWSRPLQGESFMRTEVVSRASRKRQKPKHPRFTSVLRSRRFPRERTRFKDEHFILEDLLRDRLHR